VTISSEDIAKVALLARIKITEDQKAGLEQDLGRILDLVDKLQKADTIDVEPMANPHDAVQILRSDEVTEKDRRADFQKIAPATEDGLYLVPRVIE